MAVATINMKKRHIGYNKMAAAMKPYEKITKGFTKMAAAHELSMCNRDISHHAGKQRERLVVTIICILVLEAVEMSSSWMDRKRNGKTFQRLAWEVKIMCKVCKWFRRQLKDFREYFIIRPTQSDKPTRMFLEDKSKQGEMNFDHSRFRTRQDCFPRKAEFITLKKPDWRTEEEVRFLCSLLQILPSYKQYSQNLQFLLAKVIRFERFGRRRVIIKNGHPGNSFYFIYSGCVGISSDKDDRRVFFDKEPVLLHKGAKFGDITLLKGQKRNATIVCMAETEFLVVDKEDYFADKLDDELQKEFQYRFEFFRSLNIFSHLPTKHLEMISESCQTRYFHYGQLVIPDTSESTSIAFVTEGTCELLMLVNLTTCPSYHKWLHHKIALPLPNYLPTQKTYAAWQKHFRKIILNSRPVLEPIYDKSRTKRTSKRDICKNIHSKATVKCNTDQTNTEMHRDIKKTPMTFEGMRSVIAAAVYLRIGVLNQREFLGLEEICLLSSLKDKRSKVLVSNHCKIIFLNKDIFDEFCDEQTIKKLQRYQRTYPSDDSMCQQFLQQNDWEIFKKDLVNLVLEPLSSRHRHVQTSELHQSGILDLCSIFPNKPKKPRGVVIPAQGIQKGISLLETSPRLVHAIVVPRADIRRSLY
ncbi:cyclic nucleotide-binding domain-containing protein 2 [Pelodytes ibericus]